MEVSEKKLVHTLHEQLERLLCGEPASPVAIDPQENTDLVSLAGTLNRFITEFNEVREFGLALSSGNLDVLPLPRNLLASPFKQLHAALRHLTWQTEQIAKGDYSQRVHFMGDFSNAFNSMVEALARSEAGLHSANQELQAQNNDLARLMDKTLLAEQALQKAHDELERLVEERTAELLEKERMLMVQSRQAAMGEMIGNIAHQWRQPLNALAIIIQTLPIMRESEEFSQELLESENRAMEIIRHMSQTIDDFRDYFKPGKEPVLFHVSQALSKTIHLIEDNLKGRGIVVETVAMDDPVINGFPNEYSQALLNILMNARDALMERNIGDPKVLISTRAEGGRSVVTITDNAGGIPEDIIDRIFDPYFSTKEPERGTGVGLFMSKGIIEKSMSGRLTARNTGDGAEFRIEV